MAVGSDHGCEPPILRRCMQLGGGDLVSEISLKDVLTLRVLGRLLAFK